MDKGALKANDIFSDLEIKIPEVLSIEPYCKIPLSQWHKVPNGQGGYDSIPLGWRNLGHYVKYPSVRINDGIAKAGIRQGLEKVEGRRGKTQVERFYQPGLIRYYIDNVMTGVYLIDKPHTEIEWNDSTKEHLYKNFMACPFLWNCFADEYDILRGESAEDEKKEKENFLTPSTSMSENTSPNTGAPSGEKQSKVTTSINASPESGGIPADESRS